MVQLVITLSALSLAVVIFVYRGLKREIGETPNEMKGQDELQASEESGTSEKRAAIRRRLSKLLCRIDYRVWSGDYDGLTAEQAFLHADVIVENLDAILRDFRQTCDNPSASSAWAWQEKLRMRQVFAGLLVWGSRNVITECMYNRLEEKGVDHSFLDDAWDFSEANGMPPNLTQVTVKQYYAL